MSAVRPAWLIARPIAHRGLHDRAQGVIENSVSAARQAIAGNYAIECDVQISADGEAMVFHDATLERLCDEKGRVDAQSAASLSRIALRGSDDAITPLPRFLELIGGRVPLIVEIKSEFAEDLKLAERTACLAAAYNGPVALKSFDPGIMAHLQKNRGTLGLSHIPLGMIAEAHFDHEEWNFLQPQEKHALANFLHWQDTQPDFLSYHVNDLPHAVPHLLRRAMGLPVMTWTVRSAEQRARAEAWADQMVFEGWLPRGGKSSYP